MKNILTIVLILFTYLNGFSQLTAKIKLKEPLEGICDHDNIYSLMAYQKGQIEPEPNISEEKILLDLNNSIDFLKKHPKFKGKGFVSIIINCEGVPLRVKAKIFKKRNPEIEKELIEYFKLIKKWKPGTYYNKIVDSDRTYSFKIKKGSISF